MNKDRKIHIFDFDGTIVDVWKRFYEVFCRSLPIETDCTLEEYKSLKLMYQKDELVANQLGIKINKDYFDKKKELLESIELLSFDKLICNKEELIEYFKNNNCRILTKRRNKNIFIEELKILGIDELAQKAIVLNPNDNISKKEYIKDKFSSEEIIIVGDSRDEQSCSELENTNTVLVRTGLFNVELFELNNKCRVVDSINVIISNT